MINYENLTIKSCKKKKITILPRAHLTFIQELLISKLKIGILILARIIFQNAAFVDGMLNMIQNAHFGSYNYFKRESNLAY